MTVPGGLAGPLFLLYMQLLFPGADAAHQLNLMSTNFTTSLSWVPLWQSNTHGFSNFSVSSVVLRAPEPVHPAKVTECLCDPPALLPDLHIPAPAVSGSSNFCIKPFLPILFVVMLFS